MRTTGFILVLLAPMLAISTSACAEPGYGRYAYRDGGYHLPHRAPPIQRAPSRDTWVHPQFGPSYRSWQQPGYGWGRPAHRHWGHDRGFGHYRHHRGKRR
jgi:hypothetical protein